MTKHTGLISRFNAWFMHNGSHRYNQMVDDRKRRLFAGLTGRILEIGPGTGANLEYYPEDISLVALEPSPYMQKYLEERANSLKRAVEIITGTAEHIPLEDESVDVVISTLVLCSVDSLEKTLAEIRRVLKPGGAFLFIEHVAASRKTFLRYIQRWVKPLWRPLADGCNPDRETWKMIKGAEFRRVEIEHFRLSLPVVGPHIMGKAIK